MGVPRSRLACLALAAGVACLGCGRGPAVATPDAVSAAEVDQADPPLVGVTPAAEKVIRETAEAGRAGVDWSVRVRASWPKGVCSPQHKLDIDTNPPSAEDYAFRSGGLRLVVLKRQADMLRGARVDFGEKNGERGLIVTTPNFQGELLKTWGPILAADPLSSAK